MKINKLIKLFSILLLISSLSSCTNSVITSANYNLPVVVEKNPTKKGENCENFIFPLSLFFYDFDLTVEKARASADIKEIISIENQQTNLLFLFKRTCIVVRGN